MQQSQQTPQAYLYHSPENLVTGVTKESSVIIPHSYQSIVVVVFSLSAPWYSCIEHNWTVIAVSRAFYRLQPSNPCKAMQAAESDEGGVAAGFAVLDSPVLTD